MIRLPNGQIRYSTGMFDNYGDAVNRRQVARQKGIGDAYVTAYYKGERISVGKARRLLTENGPSILESTIREETPVVDTIQEVDTTAAVAPIDPVRTDTVTTNVVEVPVNTDTWEGDRLVQIVTKKEFEEYPRDVLNRCLLYTSPSPRDQRGSRMPSSA